MAYMTLDLEQMVAENPQGSDVSINSRLVLTRRAVVSMPQLVEDYGYHLTPAMIVGMSWQHTFLADYFQIAVIRRLNENHTRLGIDSLEYRIGWQDGYRAALRDARQEHVGWWLHQRETFNPKVGLTPVEVKNVLLGEEWQTVSSRENSTAHPVVLLTWVERRVLKMYAVELERETMHQRPIEIIWS
ncbi:hypothetical protein [Deinococcus hopiensis]|nr:hypothetical protein [Deinococcus hopiensis]